MRLVLVVFVTGFVFTAYVVAPGANYWLAALGGTVAALAVLALRTARAVAQSRLEESDQRRRDGLYLALGLASIDGLSGREFEKYVAARVRKMGWKVSATPTTGDFGVDLIAERDDECVAIQCKRRTKPVGVSAVQQVVAGALHHRCNGSAVVSNQEFTAAAKQLARTHACDLVGRSKLRSWTL
ncbi:MAG: restriction endonuclease [Mycobacteriaceae bacterium]|nr:restriction endonuclease [Mycobacteriaceae bacterium]